MIPRLSSINITMFIGIFLALLLPISFAIWYITAFSKAKLYEEFENYRQETTQNVASALADPIHFFSPNDGGLVLKVLKQDSRIVKVTAYDTLNELDFLEIHVPSRAKGELFTTKENVIKDSEIIGTVTITYNDHALVSRIQKQTTFFIQIFGLMFLTLLCVVAPLLYIKILSPLKKLTRQAQNLKEGNLKEAYTWEGKDEINLVGQSFELARQNTLDLVNKLKETSRTDQLTKLFNRHKLDKVLNEEKKRADRYHKHTFGILLIDVDNFKHVNDTYGHQMGDEVLIDIAEALQNNSREVDTVGRWGGEEFLIICPNADSEGLFSLANKLTNIIYASTFETDETVTISTGLTLYNKDESIPEMVSRADTALYEAKTTGKNKALIA